MHPFCIRTSLLWQGPELLHYCLFHFLGCCCRCETLFTQALCLTKVPQCNPALTLPAANYLRLCHSQSCFDYHEDLMHTCNDVNVTAHLPAAANRDTFCPGYVSGVCKDTPGTFCVGVMYITVCAVRTMCCVALCTNCMGQSYKHACTHSWDRLDLEQVALCSMWSCPGP